MKRLITLTIVLAVPILVAATLAASRNAAARTAPTTIHVVVKMTSANRAAGGRLGLIAGNVLAPSGGKIGRYQGECFQVTNNTNNCTFTLALPAGHIAFIGAYGPGFSANANARSPIAGGTNAYRNDRGEVDEHETGNTVQLTIHLSR